MGKIIIGYKAKKNIHKGMVVNSDAGHFEPIYEEQNPIDELADLAFSYAHIRNDSILGNHIEELVSKIKGKS